MKKKYYVLTWELQRKGVTNNYAKGYEVFTNKKEADKYFKDLRKKEMLVKFNSYTPSDLTDLIFYTKQNQTEKTNYGFVENFGFQFH